MIRHVKVTEQNLLFAVGVQKSLFPEYSARSNYVDAIEGRMSGETCVGISGIYSDPADHANAWLGWFGILPEFRRQGLGSEALRLFEQKAREDGFVYTRLYTDRDHNDAAISFYRANGYVGEAYDNPDDPASRDYPICIFSKSLFGEPVPAWDNKNIHLTRQVQRQIHDAQESR